MAKTNFMKVEDAFEEERRKLQKEALLKEADRVAGKEIEENPQIELQKKIATERKILIRALYHDLKEIDEVDFEEKIKVPKDKLELLLQKGLNLSEKDYENLKKMKKKIDNYKNADMDFDDKLVQQERKKHINKRFNVRDKWIPLK